MERLILSCIFAAAGALNITVNVHYPGQNSPFDYCGLTLKVATPFGDLENPPNAIRVGRDLFRVVLDVPDTHLYTQISLAVMADKDVSKIYNDDCMAVCPRLGPQGMLVSQGPYFKTDPLLTSNEVAIWPSFCLDTGKWTSVNATFHSAAIDNTVHIRARLPAAFHENPLRRPAHLLPPIMFRFNSEWYFANPAEEYTVWHDLMIQGVMEPFAVAEIYFDDVTWTSWDNQPIFTQQQLTPQCTCEPELQFICDSWDSRGDTTGAWAEYNGNLHHYGAAAAFADELHDLALPQILQALPEITAGTREELRLGAWGYCIGGLAAWNALTSRPGLFNIGYVGSPAMDFDCGASFDSVANLSWSGPGLRPKVYIDAGAGEGPLMDRQSLMLMRRLQERGAVEGVDVFYARADFGTHETLNLLRRALRGLLVLFGTGEETRGFYTHTAAQDLAEPVELSALSSTMGSVTAAPTTAAVGVFVASLITAFTAGRRSARVQQDGRGIAQLPLLA